MSVTSSRVSLREIHLRLEDPDKDLWRVSGLAAYLDNLDFLFLVSVEASAVTSRLPSPPGVHRGDWLWRDPLADTHSDLIHVYAPSEERFWSFTRPLAEDRPQIAISSIRSGSLVLELITENTRGSGPWVGGGALLLLALLLRYPDSLPKLWTMKRQIALERRKVSRAAVEEEALLMEAQLRLQELREAAPHLRLEITDNRGQPIDEDWFWSVSEAVDTWDDPESSGRH